MKKIPFYILIFFLSFLLFSVSCITNTANAQGEIEKEIENEVEKQLDSLIDSDLNSYFQNLENNYGFNLKEFVKGIIKGDITVSFEDIINLFMQNVKVATKNSLASIISIIVLAILSALSKSLTLGFKKDGIDKVVNWAIYGGIIATLTVIIIDCLKTTTDTIYTINDLLDKIFPIILTLITALGGVSGASLLQPITLVVSNLIIKLIINLIIPLFTATIVLTFVGHLSDAVKLEKLNKSFKSIANWTLGIVFSLVTTFVTLQGLVGASIDTITIKSAKFALSSYIPILGGYLSEGFDVVLASCVLIKNALGLTTFLILITTLIAPILKILLVSLSLKMVSGFVEALGDTKASCLLYETSNNLNLLLTSIGGVGFITFLILALLIGAFNGGI